jgi:hypothetical protein
MGSKKAILTLAVLSLLALVYHGHGSASQAAGPRLPVVAAGYGGPGDILPNCATLSVLALTPNVSSVSSEVQFQVQSGWWCNWTASSKLITNITPSQGVGSQVVTGTIPANLNERAGRTAYLDVASLNYVVLRTATVSQSACCVSDCTGVDAQPSRIWPPGAFITVTVPQG